MIGSIKNCMVWLSMQPDGMYEVKPYHEKRSLNANSYFYVLQNKLAQVLKTSNDELHERLIKNYSTVTIITVPDTYDIKGFIKYYDIYNKGEIKGNSVIQYKVYKPSHEMNIKEFSRLLDGLISECKEMEIETKTPDQLLELEGYEVQTNNNK